MKQLQNKVALITGAARGIGRSIAIKLASEGADVAITYLHNQDQSRGVVGELRSLSVKANAYCSDASNFLAAHQLVTNIIGDFGKIDILINNAGITKDNLLLRMDEQAWDDVINNNLKSVFNMTKAVIPMFIKQNFGVIVNVSSVVGMKGNKGQSNYAASKAGIIGFTKSVALELGSKNIRCNAIAPGFIVTDMTSSLTESAVKEWSTNIPLKRLGTPDDVANCALFLVSESSSYITGQVITVDGGLFT